MPTLHFVCQIDAEKSSVRLAAWDFMVAFHNALGKVDISNVFLSDSNNVFFAKVELPESDNIEAFDKPFQDLLSILQHDKYFTHIAITDEPHILSLFSKNAPQKDIKQQESPIMEDYQIIWNAEKKSLGFKNPGKDAEFITISAAERYLLNPIMKELASKHSFIHSEDNKVHLHLTEKEFNHAVHRIKQIDSNLVRFSSSPTTTKESISLSDSDNESIASTSFTATSVTKEKLKDLKEIDLENSSKSSKVSHN